MCQPRKQRKTLLLSIWPGDIPALSLALDTQLKKLHKAKEFL